MHKPDRQEGRPEKNPRREEHQPGREREPKKNPGQSHPNQPNRKY